MLAGTKEQRSGLGREKVEDPHQSWKPHRSPLVTMGISECTIPRPALMYCTPPGPIVPCTCNHNHCLCVEAIQLTCCLKSSIGVQVN